MNKYRKLVIDYSDFLYTGIVQVHKPFHWVTIKYFESDDLEYLNLCMDELLEMLEQDI